MEFTPTLYHIVPVQTINNGTKVVDIECKKRAEITLNGSAQVRDFCAKTDYSSDLRSIILSVVNEYIKEYFIESINVSKTREGSDSYSFSSTVSYLEDAAFAL